MQPIKRHVYNFSLRLAMEKDNVLVDVEESLMLEILLIMNPSFKTSMIILMYVNMISYLKEVLLMFFLLVKAFPSLNPSSSKN